MATARERPPEEAAEDTSFARGLRLLLLLGVAAMALISPVDYRWTAWLLRHDVPAFSNAMARSVFEGAWPGGTDPTAVYLAAVVLLYLGASRRRALPALAAWRGRLGFMMSSALVGGLLFVHSVRWVLGRYRPGYVIKDGKPFTAWYEMGPQFATDAHYRGSFPSGHTMVSTGRSTPSAARMPVGVIRSMPTVTRSTWSRWIAG